MKKNKVLIIIFLQFIVVSNLLSQQIVSPFNKLSINDSVANYSFIVSGHFHGASTNVSSFPASSLLANIDSLNSLNPLFLMSLGDMFLDVDDLYIKHYQYSLFNKLKMPLLNAVGNHDLSNHNMYEKAFGKTFFSFTHNSELFIVLNSELNDGSIKDEQLKMFTDALNSASSTTIKNIFIFSHRPIWAESIEKYKKLFTDNTRSSFQNNFLSDIKPLLQSVSKKCNMFWISGSMGGTAPVSFFYDKDEETNVTYMQTAIRDLPRDAVLQIFINNGIVSLKGKSFSGQKLDKIENYNLNFWSKNIAPEQKFNFRLLPFLIMQMLKHYYFWIGFLLSIVLILVTTIIKRRWKKEK